MATLKDVIANMKDNTELTKVELTGIVNAVFDQITAMLAEGEKVLITGFGTFTPSDTPERMGYNPVTKKKDVVIPAHRVVKFRSLPALKENVNRTKG